MPHQIPDQHMQAVAKAMTTIFQTHQLSMSERAAMVQAMNIHFQHHQAAVPQGEPTYESEDDDLINMSEAVIIVG
jgi:hypothetical protein